MEQFEFEKEAKTKLSNRELKVSADAWSRLTTQLDTQDKKEHNINYRYLLVAASIVGVLFAIMLFKNTGVSKLHKDVVIVLPEVKDVEERKTQIKDTHLVVESSEIKEKEVQDTAKKVALEKKPEIKRVVVMANKSKEPLPSGKPIVQEIVNVVDTAAGVSGKVVEENVLSVAFSDSVIQEQVSKLTSLVTSLEEEKKEVTEAEIDALLRQAQEQILIDKYHRDQQSVDATALLLDVEAELDQTFKEQVFEALKTSFNKVRTAMRR